MTVHGSSMMPRLADGQRVEVEETSCGKALAHGDIVVFLSAASHMPLIKAVRGMAGDRIALHGDRLLINDAIVTNSQRYPYRLDAHRMAMLQLYVNDYDGTIPTGAMLVMGEPTGGTLDSSRFGLITRDAIIGRMVEP